MRHAVAHAPRHVAGRAGHPAAADHDDVGVDLLGDRDERRRRVAVPGVERRSRSRATGGCGRRGQRPLRARRPRAERWALTRWTAPPTAAASPSAASTARRAVGDPSVPTTSTFQRAVGRRAARRRAQEPVALRKSGGRDQAAAGRGAQRVAQRRAEALAGRQVDGQLDLRPGGPRCSSPSPESSAMTARFSARTDAV